MSLDFEIRKRCSKNTGMRLLLSSPPGPPSREISRLAKEKSVSLVIAGSHGASLAKEVLLTAAGFGVVSFGSIAFSIVNSATVPVLIVRLKASANGIQAVTTEGGLFGNILHPTDFSDTAERAFGVVEGIVKSGAARRVTLLHVQDKERITSRLLDRLDEFNQIDREGFTRLEARLKEVGASDVQIETPYGSPVQEILKMSGKDCQLIIMGSQGRGFIAEVFLGSVSYNVVRHAPCPVLLVPALR